MPRCVKRPPTRRAGPERARIVLVIATFALASCRAPAPKTAGELVEERPRCVLPRETQRPEDPPLGGGVRDDDGPSPSLGMGSRAEQTASRLGLTGALSAVRDDPDPARRARAIHEARTTVEWARATILATTAELECEEELATRLADELERGRDRRSGKLTASAIAIGALGAIGAGVLTLVDRDEAGASLGIATGAAEAGIGVGLLAGRTGTLHLAHDPNHLRELWDGPGREALIPGFAWRWLEDAERGERSSPRERLMERLRWRTPEERALLLGTGGGYSADALRLRASLLDALEDEIELIFRDLVILLEELVILSSAARAEEESPLRTP